MKGRFGLVAVKRSHIPEALWALCAVLHLCQIQPFRWFLTTDDARAIEAAERSKHA
jgi:hypothetical protein